MRMIKRAKTRLARTGRSVFADFRRPPWTPAGHYYSPVPSRQDVERALKHRHDPVSIHMDENQQRTLIGLLNLAVPQDRRWVANNDMFGAADATVLRAILLHYRPKRFFEVGAGYSTALVLDVVEDALPDLKITCIEPYADRLRAQLRAGDSDKLTLIETAVQEVDPAKLASELEADDILFIDSTHVAKAGSDVCHLILRTLPLLRIGTIVHFHDIFWQFEYPEEWLREGRSWTEAYLLEAFLAHNMDWEILVFSSWLWQIHPELVPFAIRDQEPGSIWLRRVA